MNDGTQAIVNAVADAGYPLNRISDSLSEIVRLLNNISVSIADNDADNHTGGWKMLRNLEEAILSIKPESIPSQYVEEVDMMMDNHLKDYHPQKPKDIFSVPETNISPNKGEEKYTSGCAGQS